MKHEIKSGLFSYVVTALVFLSVPAYAEDLRWLAGEWQVEYTDAVLGEIVGIADIHASGATSTSDPLITGSVVLFGPDLTRYELNVDYLRVEDGNVQIHLKGESPPSGLQGVADLIQGDAEVIPAKADDVVRAVWGNARSNARVVAGEEQDLYVEFPIPADGEAETLVGRWQYSPGMISQIPANRGGEVEDDSIRITVSGREQWTRPHAQLTAIVAEDDATVDTLGESIPHHTAPFWISVAGFGLPTQPKRDAVVQVESGHVLAPGEWRVHPEHDDAIQFLAMVHRQLPPDPVPVSINGAGGHWLPVMPGIEPVSIRLVRKYSDTEYFVANEVYAGDMIYIEAEYEEAPFTNMLRYGVLVDDLYPLAVEEGGDAASADVLTPHRDVFTAAIGDDVPERTEVILRRTSEATVYRSEPILVKPADSADLPRYVQLDDREEQTVTARSLVDELLIWEIDPVMHSNSKKVVTMPVLQRPDTTLWPDALHTAQQCRDNGEAETYYWNVDYVNAVQKALTALGYAVPQGTFARNNSDVIVTEEITVEDHAAALLLRRELVRLLEQPLAYYSDAGGIPSAEIDNMIAIGFHGGSHPLFSFEIDVPRHGEYGQHFEGFRWPLEMLFRRHILELRFEGDMEAYREFLKLAVADAAGQALAATERARVFAQNATDCDVLQLLIISGRSMSALVDLVRPRLIKENPDPNAMPRFIQDRAALRAVTGVETRQASIDAIDALSSAELDVVLTVATLGALSSEIVAKEIGVRAFTALRAARLAGTTIDVADSIRLANIAYDLRTVNEETGFARGIIGIVGDARYVQAVEREKALYWGFAIGMGMRVASVAVAGPISVADNLRYGGGGLSWFVRPDTTAYLVHKAAAEGLESLNRFDRAYLSALYRKLPSDGRSYSQLDRAIAVLYGRDAIARVASRPVAPPTAAEIAAVRQALDEGRAVEELIDAGHSPRAILAEMDQQRAATNANQRIQELEAELRAMDQRRAALPDLLEEYPNRNIDIVDTLRAQGLTDDEIAGEIFSSFASSFDGFPPPFMQEGFHIQLQAVFGDDYNPAWIDSFQSRFFGADEGSMTLVGGAGGGTVNAAASGTPRRALPPQQGPEFVSIIDDGRRIDIPVGEVMYNGSFNALYRHPTNPRYLIRVNYNGMSRGLDDLGWDGLKEVFGSGVDKLRGPRRRMALAGECDPTTAGLSQGLEGLREGLAGPGREALLRQLAAGNSVEYIEVARGRLARTIAEWQNADLTPGQALEVYRNLRRLNDAGYVLLDGHGGNMFFELVRGTTDEWRMHIIDSGAVARVRGNTPAERAARATELQKRLTAPEGNIADQLAAAQNHRQRFAVERELGGQLQAAVYDGLDDASRAAVGPQENLVFVPSLARFPKVRELLTMTDAERAAELPPGALELVR